jgi:hypothetical protein
VELLFSCTYDKAQGKTMEKVILSLNQNKFKSANLSHLYVGFTRVCNSGNLRIIPTNDAKDLHRFKESEHPKEVILFNKAYNDNGIFSEELYRNANEEYENERALLQQNQEQEVASSGGRRGGRRGSSSSSSSSGN